MTTTSGFVHYLYLASAAALAYYETYDGILE